MGEEIRTSQQLLATLLPPPPVVCRAAQYLPESSDILDVGAGNGRSGYYLASRGHSVTSLEADQEQIDTGRFAEQYLGSWAVNNRFEHGDMEDIEYDEQFDAVICTYALHVLATKRAAMKTMLRLQQASRCGGLNILAAYIATEEEARRVPHRTFFQKNELFKIYKELGWQVIDQNEVEAPMHQLENGETVFSSHSELIARKTRRPRISFMNANRQIVTV